MLKKLLSWFGIQVKSQTEPVVEPSLSAKDLATQNGEPYISVTQVELNPTNINDGSFVLDWNDKFVTNLIRAGYQIDPSDTDAEIVERWFEQICRNIALEFHQQTMADPVVRQNGYIKTRDLGNGRTEIG